MEAQGSSHACRRRFEGGILPLELLSGMIHATHVRRQQLRRIASLEQFSSCSLGLDTDVLGIKTEGFCRAAGWAALHRPWSQDAGRAAWAGAVCGARQCWATACLHAARYALRRVPQGPQGCLEQGEEQLRMSIMHRPCTVLPSAERCCIY